MRENDARLLDRKSQESLRERGVRAVQSGQSPEEVARTLDVAPSTVYGWLAKYRSGGWDSLKRRKAPGRPPKISGRYLKWIYQLVTTKTPDQLSFPFALWTRPLIKDAIKKKYGFDLSISSVGRLLAQLGLTCQKPLHKAYEQNPDLVKEWLKKEFPKIKRLARKEGADIYFGDEAGLRSDYHSGTTWAPKGQTPVSRKTGKRFSMNMISAVTSKGKMKFMTVKGKMNSSVFINFLEKLLKDSENPVYLIVDGHPSHKSKMVKYFIDQFDGWLKLFYLPPYSPELNPDELVWSHLKYHGIGKLIITSKDELHKKVLAHLRSLQRSPEIIKGFFRKQSLRYAL